MDNIKYSVFVFLFSIVVVKLVLFPVNEYLILPKYLEYKVKDIGNIKKGYACYKGKYKTRNGAYVYEYNVNNASMTSFSGLKVEFPFLYKRGDFFKKIEINSPNCVHVSYVEVNYFFIKKKYIYDFI